MKILVVSLVLLLCVGGVVSQQINTKTYSTAVDKATTVLIELEGDIIINSWDLPKIDVKVESVVTGRVWGYSNIKKRGDYNVCIENSGGMVIVRPVPRKRIYTIGISTIRESNTHYIYLPSSAKVVVHSQRGRISVNGIFDSMDIENCSGSVELKIIKSRVRFVGCSAVSGKVLINGSNEGKRFKLIGTGNSVYTINSDTGDIVIDLINDVNGKSKT